MSNTSATGGFLQPTTSPPDNGQDLDVSLQAVVVGITGLSGTLVRPRWQPKPPAQPSQEEDWCAIGVMRNTPEPGAASVTHVGTGDGHDELRRHEELEILASFYGPRCSGYAAMLRDGLYIAQNREALYALGMGLIDTDPLINASQIQNQIWVRRIDLSFRLRRRVDRSYAVQNVLEADGVIHKDGGSTEGAAVTDDPFAVKE